jgi:hypothetical protein
MSLLSHTGDNAAEATWLRRDVDAESCRQRCYQGDLAAVRCRCRVMQAIDGDGGSHLPSGEGYIDLAVRDTHDPTSDQRDRIPCNRITMQPLVINQRCPVDLATKAKSLLAK